MLDLGCGNGKYSAELENRGALVFGIDYSVLQLLEGSRSYRAVVGDARQLPLENNEMDLVFMNLVVPDIPDTDSLHRVFSESYRVLKQGGRFLFSTLHPFYLLSEQDESDHAVSFDPAQYFNDGHTYPSRARLGDGSTIEFNETHFSLEQILRSLIGSGFEIKDFRESLQCPERDLFLPKYMAIASGKGIS